MRLLARYLKYVGGTTCSSGTGVWQLPIPVYPRGPNRSEKRKFRGKGTIVGNV